MDRNQGEQTEKHDLSAWADLIRFKPPETVLKLADARLTGAVRLQALEDGWGDINLDYYPIHVDLLPYKPATRIRFEPEELLEYFRLSITGDTFIDTSVCEFSLYDKATEGAIWNSKCAESAVIHIDMKVSWLPSKLNNPDDGSVICSRHEATLFRFSTVKTLADNLHPVNGNREFGVWTRPGAAVSTAPVHAVTRINLPQYVFYTRGADRVTDLDNHIMNRAVFGGGHELWSSLQRKFSQFVSRNGGLTEKRLWNISQRHDWKLIRKKYFDVAQKAVGGAAAAATEALEHFR